MATLIKIKRKNGTAYRVQYMANYIRYSKSFSVGTPIDTPRAFKKDIEAQIAKYRAGLTDRIPEIDGGLQRRDKITLKELTEELRERRRNDVDPLTLTRNMLAMRNFMGCLGQDFMVMKLTEDHIEQFKNFRLDSGTTSKEGVNKDLDNIKALLNYAVKRGLVDKNPVPTIVKFKTERRLPKFYTPEEIIKLKQNLEGEIWLAFLLFIYTGARRCEICQYKIGDGRGLRWKDILWVQSQIKVRGKNSEKIKPMRDFLRSELRAEMERRRQNGTLDLDDLVVHYTGPSVTAMLRKVLKSLGIYSKRRVIHAFRHTVATETLKATGDLRLTQELLDHKNIATTQIYTHIVSEQKHKAVESLPY